MFSMMGGISENMYGVCSKMKGNCQISHEAKKLERLREDINKSISYFIRKSYNDPPNLENRFWQWCHRKRPRVRQPPNGKALQGKAHNFAVDLAKVGK